MLVLSRRVDERIFVGDHVIITLIAVENGKAKIGIDAPDDIRVDREEIRQKIEREGYRAPAMQPRLGPHPGPRQFHGRPADYSEMPGLPTPPISTPNHQLYPPEGSDQTR